MPETNAQNPALARMLFEANKKSVGVAYLLWFFLWFLGAHRFYAGKIASAVVMLILSALGWLTLIVGVGFVLVGLVGIWALVDAFLIPGWIRKHNTALAMKFAA